MTAHEILKYDIPPDRPDSPCAACGVGAATGPGGGGTRRPVADDRGRSSLLMLCVDAAACARRYRKGLTPAQFAEQLRNDSFRWGFWKMGSGA